MSFYFPNPKTNRPREIFAQKSLEKVYGILTWSTLLGIPLASFFFPIGAAVYIILFDLYWILRVVYISYYSIRANLKMTTDKKIDWLERCRKIGKTEKYLFETEEKINSLEKDLEKISFFSLKDIFSLKKKIGDLKNETEEIKKVIPFKNQILEWTDIIHVVLLPTAGEPADVIEPAIQSLLDSNFPKNQIIILLATEERENPETRLSKIEYLRKKFGGSFRDFLVTTHIVSAGEIKCKASNATFAARELVKYLDNKNIDYKKVVFSNFDCDTVIHPEYLAALTYFFIINPKRLQRAYQPIPIYNNNIWDTNSVVRLIVTGSSFWHLFQSTRREMVTFSSHSEPFDTLVKVDFWPVNMISEDSIIYWKCLTYFDGDYEVQPIHLPASLDAVLAENYWKTLKNQYKQKRRWAYGAENFPVTMRAIWPNKKISFGKKIRITFEMLESNYSWATTSFILAFLGWLPTVTGGNVFQESVLGHNLPITTRILMTISMFGLLVSIPLSLLSLPPKPRHYRWTRYLTMLFQWVLFPFVAFFSAIPAIDSQTRLLLGKYFGEFWVTEKMKKKTD